MQNTPTRKLEGIEPLSDQDRRALNGPVPSVRRIGHHVELMKEGQAPETVHLILDGFACGNKVLPDGVHKIMGFLVPGDFCDLSVFILDQTDHEIGIISQCQITGIPRGSIDAITAHRPLSTHAFRWCALVGEAILREWLVNMGGRAPNQRVAHGMCELPLRLEAVGQVTGNSFPFPFTRTDLADPVGLSNVHVNGTLRELKARGLITLGQRILTIHDPDRLKAYCEFTPNYLHLRNARWEDRRTVPWVDSARRG